MKNLLVITYHFPPLETIAAHRFGKMCRYMRAFGWNPIVICPHSEGTLAHGLDHDQIFRVGDNDAGLTRAGTQRTTRGMNPLIAPLYTLGKRLQFNLRAFDQSVVTWRRTVLDAWPRIYPKLPTIHAVLSSYGPSAPQYLARRFAKQLGAPWIVDYRDACSLFPWGRHGLVRALDAAIEHRLIAPAAGFVTVSPTLHELIAQDLKKDGAVIYNGWDPSEQQEQVESGDYLFYGGRLYPHQMDAVSTLLQALALEPNHSLLFLSLGPPDLEQRMRQQAKELGIEARIEIRPPVPPAEAAALAAGARATLVVEDFDTSGLWSRGTLTGKLMQLIALPAPVLCVARADSDIGGVLQRTGKGRLCADVAGVRGFLKDLAAGYPQADAAGIQSFSREAQAGELCRFLDRFVPGVQA